MNTIALVGNPNVGKTSLFNALTHTYQKVGNWTGVTVSAKEEKLYGDKQTVIVDLPGLYSFSGDSLDEKAVYSYLKSTPPSVIINVIDGMNLERNLALTISLLSMGIPVIVAINFCDELEKNGYKINYEKLSDILKVPVVKISAKKGIGLKELLEKAKSYNVNKKIVIELSANGICEKVLKKGENKSKLLTEKTDNILLNKFLGPLILIAVIFSVYFLALKIGGILGDILSDFFNSLKLKTVLTLKEKGTPEYLITFLSVALINGVGQVVSFLPQLLILFFLLTFLEESGYMSRVAFIFDRIFRSIGINGKSVFPLVLSMGCTVSGISATRTIENDTERERTVMLIPFMPCGAKLVVFAWGSKVFFGGSPLIATSLFFLSLIIIIVVGKITLKSNKSENYFLLEMPIYRFPNLKNCLKVVIEKIKDFVFRAGSIIFTVSVVYWFLICFGKNGYDYGDLSKSFLFDIGSVLKYIFYPLGFYDWKIATSLVAGLIARESVVETLSMTAVNLNTVFLNSLSVYSFLAFVMISPPCIATISQAKQELKSNKKVLKMFGLEFLTAYAVSLFFRIINICIICPLHLILFLVLAIMIVAIIYSIKKGERRL